MDVFELCDNLIAGYMYKIHGYLDRFPRYAQIIRFFCAHEIPYV